VTFASVIGAFSGSAGGGCRLKLLWLSAAVWPKVTVGALAGRSFDSSISPISGPPRRAP
jgi:hypothetical protein